MKDKNYNRRRNLKKLARKNKLNLFDKKNSTFILILKSDLDKKEVVFIVENSGFGFLIDEYQNHFKIY